MCWLAVFVVEGVLSECFVQRYFQNAAHFVSERNRQIELHIKKIIRARTIPFRCTTLLDAERNKETTGLISRSEKKKKSI